MCCAVCPKTLTTSLNVFAGWGERTINGDDAEISSLPGISRLISCLNFVSPGKAYLECCLTIRATGTGKVDELMRCRTITCVRSSDSASLYIFSSSNLLTPPRKETFTVACSVASIIGV